jgi:uncharacterized membrane protein YidH (DUF202 family)
MAITERHVSRVLVGAGALLVFYGAVRWWHGERVFARMRATTCTLVIKQVEAKLLVRSGRGWRSERLRYRDEARFVFAHTVDGRKYTFREDFTADRLPLADYEEGKTYPCRYDPEDPGHATIMTAFDRDEVGAVLILGGALIFFGATLPGRWRRAQPRTR